MQEVTEFDDDLKITLKEMCLICIHIYIYFYAGGD
jgi:hypothetical protein